MPSLDNMMLRQIIMDHYENPRNHELVEDDSYKKVNMDSEDVYKRQALAVKAAHEINPDLQVGCMIGMNGVYPASPKPEDMMNSLGACLLYTSRCV